MACQQVCDTRNEMKWNETNEHVEWNFVNQFKIDCRKLDLENFTNLLISTMEIEMSFEVIGIEKVPWYTHPHYLFMYRFICIDLLNESNKGLLKL